ncbi:Protein of unknown function [Cotesia congregata]|uniref:Envelope fusion protein n=1 Tax=Cotesia congregata TaxID=51543 RepID=A0A8J2EIA3_COTCN|nr:Protein of unknown function [Cotesia congregata]
MREKIIRQLGLVNLYPHSNQTLWEAYGICSLKFNHSICMSYMRVNSHQEIQAEIEQAQHRLRQLLEDPQLEEFNPRNRIKRAPWFGFVGTIARELFGTMDYSDKEHITEEINKLYQDNRELVHLSQNNTHIIRSEINEILKHEVNITERIKEVVRTSAYLKQAVNKQLSDLQRSQLFSMATDEHIHLMTNHLRTLNNASKTIEEAKWGKLTYLTVSAKQLHRATADMMEKHPTLNPPQPLDHMDINTLARVSTVETGKTNGHFLIIITVPLFDQMPWLAYEPKSLPKPEKIGDQISTLTIQPTSKYLVSEPSFDEYFLAGQDYINSCKPIGPDMACPPDFPSKTTKLENEVDCEMKLLMDPKTENLRECNIRIIQKSENRIINGTGLIHIQQGCQVNCNEYTIRGIARESIKIDLIAPSFNLSLETLNSSLKINDAVPNLFTQSQDPATIIDKFEPWGQELEENEEKMSLIALDHQKEEINRKITIGSVTTLGIISLIIGGKAIQKTIRQFLSKPRKPSRVDEKPVIIQLRTVEKKTSTSQEVKEPHPTTVTTEEAPGTVEKSTKPKTFRLRDYKSPIQTKTSASTS